jgi:hypothetical protein
VKVKFILEAVGDSGTVKEGLKPEPEGSGPSHGGFPLNDLRAHDQIDCGRQAIPIGGFLFELSAAGGSKRVEASAAAGFGLARFGFDPAVKLKAMQCGIEGALLDLQDLAGDLLDALGDGPAVLRLQGEGFEDEEVESALNEIARFGHTMIIYNKDR